MRIGIMPLRMGCALTDGRTNLGRSGYGRPPLFFCLFICEMILAPHAILYVK